MYPFNRDKTAIDPAARALAAQSWCDRVFVARLSTQREALFPVSYLDDPLRLTTCGFRISVSPYGMTIGRTRLDGLAIVRLTYPCRTSGITAVFGEGHLRRIAEAYTGYYNECRTHLSLDKDSPGRRPTQRLRQLVARPILRGLHHQYCRI
jgi:transposase InsO family protein